MDVPARMFLRACQFFFRDPALCYFVFHEEALGLRTPWLGEKSRKEALLRESVLILWVLQGKLMPRRYLLRLAFAFWCCRRGVLPLVRGTSKKTARYSVVVV